MPAHHHRLVMSFRGICLHLTKRPLPSGGSGYRVVAVDASKGAQSGRFGPLPPHDCFLEAGPEETLKFKAAGITPTGRGMALQGWRIRIMNAADRPLDVDLRVVPVINRPSRLDNVPCLTDYCPGMKLRRDLLDDEVPAQAACFVDIEHGTIRAYDFVQGGVYTTWTVVTDGDPRLELTDRSGKSVIVTLSSTPSRATLSDGVPGSLVLRNTARDLRDGKYDFVLHYLAREEGIPEDLKDDFPQDEPPPESYGRDTMITTTSCSNSQYP
jgi:hypothetical protein